MSDDEDPIGKGDGYDNSGGVFDTTEDEEQGNQARGGSGIGVGGSGDEDGGGICKPGPAPPHTRRGQK